MTHAAAKKKPKTAKFFGVGADTFLVSIKHSFGWSIGRMNRNAIACCPVLHTLDRQQREKNDAPETHFDRCFPHEPIQEQAKAPAGQALPRPGQGVTASDMYVAQAASSLSSLPFCRGRGTSLRAASGEGSAPRRPNPSPGSAASAALPTFPTRGEGRGACLSRKQPSQDPTTAPPFGCST